MGSQYETGDGAIHPTRIIPPESEPVIPDVFGGIPNAPVSEAPKVLNLLVYGKPGVGKTTLVSQASKVPAMSPVLYMTPDRAEADTLRHAAPTARHAQINKFTDFAAIYQAAYDDCYNTPGPPTFKTYVVDTGTVAQQLSMDDIMAHLVKHGRPGGGEVDPEVPSVREWGKSTNQMRRLVRDFRGLPVNFIMICHEQEERDNRAVDWHKPDLPGKLKNQIAGMFSTVVCLYIVSETDQAQGSRVKVVTKETRCLLTGLTDGYVCKARTDSLPRIMPNPEIGDVYERVTSFTEE